MRLKLLLLEDPKKMYDSEVHEKLTESKEWEKIKDSIITAMEKFQENAIGTTVDLKQMVEKVDTLANLLTAKIEGLKLVDKERGLFTLATNKSKDTVVFPTVFSGKVGKNVLSLQEGFHGSHYCQPDQRG